MIKDRLRSYGEAVDARIFYFLGLLPLVLCFAGCSQPRKPVEEIDWGKPAPRAMRPTLSAEGQPSSGVEDGKAAAAPDGTGSDGSDADMDSDGAGGAASGAGVASTSANTPAVAEGAEAGAPRGGGEVPAPTEPEKPAPALPGRAAKKPDLSAADAATSAERLLRQAQQLIKRDDLSSAVETALEAYDQVLPHAQSDPRCLKLCRQLEVVLDAAGRGQATADAVPTRFE
jgi:hypothetical protein